MRPLNILTEAQAGQTISFIYRGGSTLYMPGSRTVKVDKVEDGRVHGYDQSRPEGDNYRQYKKNNAFNVVVLEEAPEPVPVAVSAEAACECACGSRDELSDSDEIDAMMRMLGILPPEGPMVESRVNFVDARIAIKEAVEDASSEDLACHYRNIVVATPQSSVNFDPETGELVILQPERKILAEISARIGDETLEIAMDNLGKKTILHNGEEISDVDDVSELVEKMGDSLRL